MTVGCGDEIMMIGFFSLFCLVLRAATSSSELLACMDALIWAHDMAPIRSLPFLGSGKCVCFFLRQSPVVCSRLLDLGGPTVFR